MTDTVTVDLGSEDLRRQLMGVLIAASSGVDLEDAYGTLTKFLQLHSTKTAEEPVKYPNSLGFGADGKEKADEADKAGNVVWCLGGRRDSPERQYYDCGPDPHMLPCCGNPRGFCECWNY